MTNRMIRLQVAIQGFRYSPSFIIRTIQRTIIIIVLSSQVDEIQLLRSHYITGRPNKSVLKMVDIVAFYNIN